MKNTSFFLVGLKPKLLITTVDTHLFIVNNSELLLSKEPVLKPGIKSLPVDKEFVRFVIAHSLQKEIGYDESNRHLKFITELINKKVDTAFLKIPVESIKSISVKKMGGIFSPYIIFSSEVLSSTEISLFVSDGKKALNAPTLRLFEMLKAKIER